MQKKILIAICLAALVAVTGCSNPNQPSRTVLADNQMVNIYLLAGRLGMTIISVDKKTIEFEDSQNKVMLYLNLNQVYVNNSYLGPIGRTKKIDKMISVRSSLEQDIRNALPAKTPAIIIPAPKEQPCPPRNHAKWLIVIDPGHGGKDPGAISVYGFHEKTVNLNVALKVAAMLKDQGYSIILTRNSDKFIALDERAAIANRNNTDLFISIHADSCATNTINGYTLYVSKSASNASLHLARSIDTQMANTGLKSKGTRMANYRVLTNTSCPAVMVEMGYLSNYLEAKKLKNKSMQQKIANAIVAGIQSHIDR